MTTDDSNPNTAGLFVSRSTNSSEPACDAQEVDPSAPWPAALRVKPVRNAAGVLEMTWSLAGPDGRATFELITVDDDLRCLWRRVGDHAVFERL